MSGSGRRRAGIRVAGATVLVTGATGGLGRAIAGALHHQGARLLLSGRRADELETLAAAVGGRAIVADLADHEQVAMLAAEAVAAETDALVANAALPASGLLVELSVAEIDRMLAVNLRAPIVLAHALAPAMAARGAGALVLISSLSGRAAAPASSLYSATKFGLRGFALGLRQDLHRDGVAVSLVSPGFIRDAGMYADAAVTLPPGTGTRTPEDVAGAVIRAIESGRVEIDVASLPLRAAATFASLAPGIAAAGARLLGSDRVSRDLAERQRGRRS